MFLLLGGEGQAGSPSTHLWLCGGAELSWEELSQKPGPQRRSRKAPSNCLSPSG